MRTINFAGSYKKVNKTFDEIVKERAKKKNFPFIIGSVVSINFNSKMSKFENILTEKYYNVVDISWDFANNDFFIGIDVNGKTKYALPSDLVLEEKI